MPQATCLSLPARQVLSLIYLWILVHFWACKSILFQETFVWSMARIMPQAELKWGITEYGGQSVPTTLATQKRMCFVDRLVTGLIVYCSWTMKLMSSVRSSLSRKEIITHEYNTRRFCNMFVTKWKILITNAAAGNRTRAACVTGQHSTTSF